MTITTIGCANPALGMLPNSIYRETTARLTPGDALLLYTDGATELFDGQDHELGREGLLQLARGQTTDGSITGFHQDQLEEQLLQFSNEIQLQDDLTLIKLCRRC